MGLRHGEVSRTPQLPFSTREKQTLNAPTEPSLLTHTAPRHCTTANKSYPVRQAHGLQPFQTQPQHPFSVRIAVMGHLRCANLRVTASLHGDSPNGWHSSSDSTQFCMETPHGRCTGCRHPSPSRAFYTTWLYLRVSYFQNVLRRFERWQLVHIEPQGTCQQPLERPTGHLVLSGLAATHPRPTFTAKVAVGVLRQRTGTWQQQ